MIPSVLSPSPHALPAELGPLSSEARAAELEIPPEVMATIAPLKAESERQLAATPSTKIENRKMELLSKENMATRGLVSVKSGAVNGSQQFLPPSSEEIQPPPFAINGLSFIR